jgi:hypothetical protein
VDREQILNVKRRILESPASCVPERTVLGDAYGEVERFRDFVLSEEQKRVADARKEFWEALGPNTDRRLAEYLQDNLLHRLEVCEQCVDDLGGKILLEQSQRVDDLEETLIKLAMSTAELKSRLDQLQKLPDDQ